MTEQAQTVPIEVKGKCLYTAEQRKPLILSALDRGIPRMPLYAAHEDELILVCSGPSVRNQVGAIRALHGPRRPILAVKGAHDFLLENDIVPDMAVAVDPQPHTVKYFQRHQQQTLYILASQCPTELFDLLVGRRQCLFHCHGPTTRDTIDAWAKANPRVTEHLTVTGGSSSGLRAFNIAHMLGFRMLHIFGMDSCLQADNERKVNGEFYDEPHRIMDIFVGEEMYRCDPAMAAQASEFQDILEHMSDLSVSVYGPGLIEAIARHRIEKGCKQCRLPDSG